MPKRYFEDWPVGESLESGTLTLSRESVLAFARDYDPQPFHLDDAAAAQTIFGRLAASGWQTASATMRLIVDGVRLDGVGLGVDELRWHKPVYPGDTLRVVTECASKRATPEKPHGVIHFKNTTFNQHGDKVMSHVAIVLVQKRPTP
jgi:acyl dehydratase